MNIQERNIVRFIPTFRCED